LIPCPACGWYQSIMISEARKRYQRWMHYVGLCLTVGLVPATPIGLFLNQGFGPGMPLIPWSIFFSALGCMFAVGVGIFIWRRKQANSIDPNDEDVNAHKDYGQCWATLLSAQEAQDLRVFTLHGPDWAGVASEKEGTALARGKRTKVVHCEACPESYAYELRRTVHGDFTQAAVNCLEQALTTGIEAIPCPACGWYQVDMIPGARNRHRRWMVYLGQCLTLGIIPLTVIGLMISALAQIPWYILVIALVCVFAVGVGMFVWRNKLAEEYNPNADDVDARKRYGQSRAILLFAQEVQDVCAPGGPPDRFPYRS